MIYPWHRAVFDRLLAGRERQHHALLLSGPAGIGKAALAMELARARLCERPAANGSACGRCDACAWFDAGNHPDFRLLTPGGDERAAAEEGEAAPAARGGKSGKPSREIRIEQVRALDTFLEVGSHRGGARVIVVEPADAMNAVVANALLKRLEEPPPGLVFILATTEPERLPPTVLSRCQHFRFRRLTDDEIRGKLARLANAAGVAAETAALDLVARSADGGMRDAESLLERLLASGEAVTLVRTEDALGLPPHERLRAMASALANGDLASLLAEADALYRAGFAPRTVADQLARSLRGALHALLAGEPWLAAGEDDLLRLLHALDDEQERFVRHDDLYSLEVALIKARNALLGNGPAAAAATGAVADGVMPVARGAVTGTVGETASETVGEAVTGGATGPAPARRRPSGSTPRAAGAEAPPSGGARGASPEPDAAPGGDPAQVPADGEQVGQFSWHAVRSQADLRLKAFLAPVRVEHSGSAVRVTFPEANEFHHKQLIMRLAAFEELLTAVVGPGFDVTIDGPAGTSRFTTSGSTRGGGPKKA